MKKTKLKRYFWLALILTPALLILIAAVLISRKPSLYNPIRVEDSNQISPYLTHYLLPTFYNKSQLGTPFEVIITQDGLNDVLARWPQPIMLNNLTLTDPQVVLTPTKITMMATVKMGPLNPVMAIELNPFIDQTGLLNLCVNKVTLGNVDITDFSLSMGNKAYYEWLDSTGTDPNDISAQAYRSLLENIPFEPVFEIASRTVRMSRFEVATKKIIVSISPIAD